MDPRLFHQADDACVLRQVLLTEELKKQQQQLTAEYLIAMGPCDVVELGLTLTKKERHRRRRLQTLAKFRMTQTPYAMFFFFK